MQPSHDLAASIAQRLGGVEGVIAVALGGSSATSSADGESDLDLGLYYYPSTVPSRDALNHLAAELDDANAAAPFTHPGEWGPWVNGGAWLTVGGTRLDVLYRDLEQVTDTVRDCKAGRVSWNYSLGHPHAFLSSIYLAEVHYGLPLFDPGNTLLALKATVQNYPETMRRDIIQRSLFEAGFSLENARKPAARRDTAQVAGYLYRAAASLTQAVYAANKTYLMNEKGGVPRVDSLEHRPPKFAATVQAILARPGDTPDRLTESVARMERLNVATARLCEELLGK